eukprot:TRINITY_DN76420_c0_g1_i1.p1 TRINITY_DN76420_c0_g1~~TRINITY_DN76420_c0_g1_i1.p1  ORF type:complete len:518 (-),score=102.98 TRINITY_DN76420_c0_g1_i1:145-1698(-)
MAAAGLLVIRLVSLLVVTVCLAKEEDAPVDETDGSACEDRDDRWAVHGSNCEKMKRMCDNEGAYGELVRSWCPVSCGLCTVAEQVVLEQHVGNATKVDLEHAGNSTGVNDSKADDRRREWRTVGSAKIIGTNKSNASQPVNGTNTSHSKNPDSSCEDSHNLSNGSCSRQAQAVNGSAEGEAEMSMDSSSKSSETAAAKTSGAQVAGGLVSNVSTRNVSAGNVSRSLLERGPDVRPILGGSFSSLLKVPVKAGVNLSLRKHLQSGVENKSMLGNLSVANLSAGKALLLLEELEESGVSEEYQFQITGGAGSLAGVVNLDMNFSAPERQRLKEKLQELVKSQPAELEDEDNKKKCPEGWEHVVGDVYGGDQFTGTWQNAAESMEDCAFSCLSKPGCGSFEYSPSKKRCFRNSQTRPTHEQDRGDFVFCRRRPCPSFKTHEACVGPGVGAGHYSKDVKLRPGSYCIWSGGHCQAPMACTDQDCFLPDGGLPGMELPSRYTLWISKAALQSTYAPVATSLR